MIIFVGRGVCVGEVYVYGEWVKVGKKSHFDGSNECFEEDNYDFV